MTQDQRTTPAAARNWEKAGWRAYPRIQMPDYPDTAALNAVEAQLAKYPPLVFAGEARRLRAQPETAHSVLFAISGYGQDHDRRNAIAAGFAHHLVKPVEIERLAQLLATVRPA